MTGSRTFEPPEDYCKEYHKSSTGCADDPEGGIIIYARNTPDINTEEPGKESKRQEDRRYDRKDVRISVHFVSQGIGQFILHYLRAFSDSIEVFHVTRQAILILMQLASVNGLDFHQCIFGIWLPRPCPSNS